MMHISWGGSRLSPQDPLIEGLNMGESCMTLYRRPSSSRHFGNLNSSSSKHNQNSINSLKGSSFAFLHIFNILLCATNCMKCKICRILMMDVIPLNCGHCFCQFCLAKWLSAKERCPICMRIDVHPICYRCYQMDALVEFLHSLILKIFQSETSGLTEEISQQSPAIDKIDEDAIKVQQGPLLLSVAHRERVQRGRKLLFTKTNYVITACPNKSMLQCVSDLGFGQRSTIHGFIILVFGSFFLALSTSQMSNVTEKLELYALRRCVYVILTVYLLYTQRESMLRRSDRVGHIFWEQIFRIVTTEAYNPSHKFEKTRIMECINKREANMIKVQRYVTNILQILNKDV